MKFDCVGIGICPLDHLSLLKSFPATNTKTQSIATEIQGGGPTANAIATLARFGRSTAMIGGLGSDANAGFIAKDFQRRNVCIDGLIKHKSLPHPVADIWIDARNGYRTIVLTKKLPHILKLSKRQRELICASSFVLVDGTEPQAGIEALLLASKYGIPTMLDAGSIRETTREMIKISDMVIGSESFAKQFMPGSSPQRVVKELVSRGARLAGITLGSKGSLLYEGRKLIRQKAYPVEVVDTTGAGDVYHGTFIEGLLRKWPLEKTARFASVVAGMKCPCLGGRKGIPGFAKAIRVMASF